MRKAMAIVRLHESGIAYSVEYLKIVTKEFQDIDFTNLIKNRQYFTFIELYHDIIKLAASNGFKIEVAGEDSKIPNILLDTGNGKLLKYVFAKEML